VSSKSSGVSELADRYAGALAGLAAEGGILDAVEADARALAAAFEESADLRRFAASPLVSQDERKKALDALLTRLAVDDLTRRFVLLVADHRRLYALPAILAAAGRKFSEARGEVTAAVTAARDLNPSQTKSLADALKRATGREVRLDVAVDPKVLGGLIVKVGSRMVDSTLRSQLQRLQISIKGVG